MPGVPRRGHARHRDLGPPNSGERDRPARARVAVAAEGNVLGGNGLGSRAGLWRQGPYEPAILPAPAATSQHAAIVGVPRALRGAHLPLIDRPKRSFENYSRTGLF